MKATEDVHRLTEAIYKNLIENFNSGIRQILLTGKAYHKALQGVSATANAYNDALSRLGSSARICRGGTEIIGEAILQIAEAQREIQNKLEESTKALFTELILPLEQKLEKEFKKSHSEARKYLQGHKVALGPCNKANDSLKKFRKKTKNKYVYDNEKEAQYMRTLGKCQDKLDDYRIQGLKTALLEERRCHCFLLQRLCSLSQQNAGRHQHGVDLYSAIPEWRELCVNPHVLPQSAQLLLAQHMPEQYEPMNGGPGYHSNGFLHRDTRDTQSLGNGLRRSKSTHEMFPQNLNHFDGTKMNQPVRLKRAKTLPPRVMMGLPPPVPGGSQVQAVYTFQASIDNQLSFTQGDLITLMGEKSDGWQYGQNAHTNRLGWFPISFTAAMSSGREIQDFTMSPSQRVKSVGDLLDSRSLSEQTHYQLEHDIPGNVRRPKSLYEGPSHHPSTQPQAAWPPTPFSSLYTAPVPNYAPNYPFPQPLHDTEQIYQPIPYTINTADENQHESMYSRRATSQQPGSSPIYSTHGQPVQDKGFTSIYSSQPSPPLPPPPPPPPAVKPNNYPTTTTTGHPGIYQNHASTLPANTTDVRRMMSLPAVPPAPPVPSIPPPPAPPPPPPPPNSTMHAKPNHSPPIPPTPSINRNATPSKTQKPGPNQSSMSLLSQQPAHVTGGNRMSTSSNHGYASPARQQPSHPPPPPPAPPGVKVKGQSHPQEDYGVEEDVNYQDNPMFSTVSLKRTQTNDRSAPKI